MSPPVNISITFIPVKIGGNPSLKIQDPINLSQEIGPFGLKEFDRLKESIDDVVNDPAYDLFFHRDATHVYTFDNKAIQGGAIYICRTPRKKGEPLGSKVTAAKLISVQSAAQFEQQVQEVGDPVYKKEQTRKSSRKSKSKHRKMLTESKTIDHYNVELCVVILKEKLTKKSTQPTQNSQEQHPPVPMIVTTEGQSLDSDGQDGSNTTPSMCLAASEHSQQPTQQSKKRKAEDPLPFQFKARL